MSQANRNYYLARAEQELTVASRCDDKKVESTHRDLAERYRQLAVGMATDPQCLEKTKRGEAR